jgi:hypothetical protein
MSTRQPGIEFLANADGLIVDFLGSSTDGKPSNISPVAALLPQPHLTTVRPKVSDIQTGHN